MRLLPQSQKFVLWKDRWLLVNINQGVNCSLDLILV